MTFGGAAEHGHGGPGGEVAPGGQRDRRRAVEGHVREEPPVGCDACVAGPCRGADHEGRRLVHGPLAGVPLVVGVRQRPVAGAGRGDLARVPRLAERGLGVLTGDRVEAGPQRRDLVALLGRRQPGRGRQRVLDERVLLHRRQHDAGRPLNGGHGVGRPADDFVGRRSFPVRLAAPVPGPAPGLAADDDGRAVVACRHGGEHVVDHLLLRHADLESDRVRPW